MKARDIPRALHQAIGLSGFCLCCTRRFYHSVFETLAASRLHLLQAYEGGRLRTAQAGLGVVDIPFVILARVAL